MHSKGVCCQTFSSPSSGTSVGLGRFFPHEHPQTLRIRISYWKNEEQKTSALLRSEERALRDLMKQQRHEPARRRGEKSPPRTIVPKSSSGTRKFGLKLAVCSVQPQDKDTLARGSVYQGVTKAIATPRKTLTADVLISDPLHCRGRDRERSAARAMLQDGDLTAVNDGVERNMPCDLCNGKGWLVCDFCEGQKTNVQARNNRIYRRCPNCRAAGVVICPRCKVFKCLSYQDEVDEPSSKS